jgi:pilus assembly protein CpaE
VSAPIRVLVALDEGTDRDAIESVLPVQPGIELVGVVDSLDRGWRELAGGTIEAVLVGCSGSADQALTFAEGVSRQFPDRAVLLLYSGSVNGLSGRAVAAGAEDIVALPSSSSGGEPPSPGERERVSAEVHEALLKAVGRRRRASAHPVVSDSRILVVMGPKGGAGKTLVATSLAVTLANEGEDVLLIDLDLQFGDTALTLGLEPRKTIYDLVVSGGSLDAEKLDDYLTVHESGARVLQAPARPDQAAAVEVAFVRELFDLLRPSYNWIVVDTSPGFTPEVIAAIDVSTDICMVGTVDASSLKNTKLGLETLELMGIEPERVKLVVNRADSRVGVTPEDVSSVTGRSVDALVPSSREVARSASAARPIVMSHPNSQAARALKGLAKSYLGADRGGARTSLRRLIGRAR